MSLRMGGLMFRSVVKRNDRNYAETIPRLKLAKRLSDLSLHTLVLRVQT
jgi:hypothetical protein